MNRFYSCRHVLFEQPSILIAQTAGKVSKEREKQKKSAWSRVEKLKALMFSSNKSKSNPVENMKCQVVREEDESVVNSTAGQLSHKSKSLPDDLPHVSAWFSKRSPVAQAKQVPPLPSHPHSTTPTHFPQLHSVLNFVFFSSSLLGFPCITLLSPSLVLVKIFVTSV
jgi:hypothetical protein